MDLACCERLASDQNVLTQVQDQEPLSDWQPAARHEILGVPGALLARPHGQSYAVPAVRGPRRPFGPVPPLRGNGEELIAWYMQQGLSYMSARACICAGDWDEPLDPEIVLRAWDPITYEPSHWWKGQQRRM